MIRTLARAGALLFALFATVPAFAVCPYTGNTVLGQSDTAAMLAALNDICASGSSGAGLSQSDFDSKTGSLTETAPATDIASSGLNGRLQRIAQRLTSLIAQVPSALGAGTSAGSLSVTAATDDVMVGSRTETAPASDTASSGLNGRLQRVAQNLTSLITSLTNTIVVQSGENHIGETGNNEIAITVAQTVTASSAYASGNAVGGLITFTGATRVSGALGASGTSGLVQAVAINSKSAQTTQMDLILFNANPTGSTCTDKSAISVAAADFNKVIGPAIHVTDWTALGTPSVGGAGNLALPYGLASSTTLYGCLVTRATPTFTATTDISVTLTIIRN